MLFVFAAVSPEDVSFLSFSLSFIWFPTSSFRLFCGWRHVLMESLYNFGPTIRIGLFLTMRKRTVRIDSID